MLIEKIMNRFDRTALQWRGMGPLKYLPFLVCYVLVPVTIYILQSAGTTYHLLDTMWNQIALIYPIMAAWWTALCVEPVMGQEGELFGLYERNKWVDVLIYFVLYDIMIVPVCLWIMNRWPDYIYPEDFIGLFIQCFFSACLVYGIACLVRRFYRRGGDAGKCQIPQDHDRESRGCIPCSISSLILRIYRITYGNRSSKQA